MKKLTATSTALLITGLSIFQAAPVFAALGPGISYWAAKADIVGIPGQSLVVTNPTYAGCVNQFNHAMITHASVHGYTYTNIQTCHKLTSGHGGQHIQHERKIERKR